MHNYKSWSAFSKAVLLLVSIVSFSAFAVVNIDRTRVIFNGDENVNFINLINDGTTPTFVQIWTDNGDISMSPDQSKTPVISLPPVMKLSPGEMRSVKLILTSRQKLPPNKESLFWLNVYQVPAMSNESLGSQQKVILPLRLRLKVFVRPPSLQKPLDSSFKSLRFTSVGNELSVYNPTPWYINLNDININGEDVKNKIIGPESKIRLTLSNVFKVNKKVTYDVINDNGNVTQYSGELNSVN